MSVKKTNPGNATVRKAVTLYLAVCHDDRRRPISALAKELGIAASTAYRLILPFLEAGMLTKSERRCYLPGLTLYELTDGNCAKSVLEAKARPILEALAKTLAQTVHLGVWEDDMVTYIVKAHGGKTQLFTREGMQLEAYCSGIGKVLLANMETQAQDTYLATGPFVALTENTTTQPSEMRNEWRRIIQQGFAEDREEISRGLSCIAVPIIGPYGRVIASLSLSATPECIKCFKESYVARLSEAASAIFPG